MVKVANFINASSPQKRINILEKMSIYLTYITELPPTTEQDSRNGYHKLIENGITFGGFLVNGDSLM